ncbi:uncharacterized protein LAESUDRAFT_747883 [Laetiporus sulphureus 93-53]|uniref:Centrosomal protein ATPase n=1 Tax=Laetiporus sulphureus 93-53 TaxID=1314785 RepID=A0A165G5J6_9APHY|nr:uncharacterized protein LAESUDRAFT_747883 [Laetiporus sulphureus 93-53]KZT09858.1 hypothetical protein LAESUDRAFT_747883 [Laetiporus sulphureus 93-53]
MPPQPGVFSISYSTAQKTRTSGGAEIIDMTGPYHHHQPTAGPSRIHGSQIDDLKKDKRKREIAGRLGKEMSDRRDDAGRYYTEMISDLHSTSIQLSTRPETLPAYNLRLYPISLERSALLASLVVQEKHMLDMVQTAYDDEREKVEHEWRKGRERIRERLLEGIEERRRRAREEKDGEGAVSDVGLDSQSRAHNTRKLRNKLGGTSPPPTPLSGVGTSYLTNGTLSISTGAASSGPLLNPHSLHVDELPSPFPLPLTSTHSAHSAGYGYGNGPGATGNGRRRAKGGGRENQTVGGLGKSLTILNTVKEQEVEQDLNEIRRGNKRRRVAATTLGSKNQ